MRKLTKVSLAILSLIGLLQAIWFVALLYPLGLVSQFAQLTFLSTEWHQNIGLAVGVLTGLTFFYLLLVACFSPNSYQKITIKSEQGTLGLSKQAIDSTISKAILEQHSVSQVVVKTQLLGKMHQIQANVQATSHEQSDLEGQAAAIKETVTAALATGFNLPIKQVTVELTPGVVGRYPNNKRVI